MDKKRNVLKKINRDTFAEIWREIKWMYPYAKKYRLAILFYSIAGIVSTLLGLAGSVFTKKLIDIVTGQDTGAIWGIGAIMVGMGIGSILINSITSRISAYFSIKVQNEIQADVYDKILEADWESLHEYRSGDLLNRLNGDVSNISNAIIGWIPSFLMKIVQFIGALAIILYYDWIMALIALVSAPISLVTSRVLIGKMRSYNKEMREVSSELLAFEEDSFQNMQSIKAFDIVGHFEYEMRKVQNKYKNLTMDFNKISILTTGAMSFLGLFVSYACLGWGVYRLWTGTIVFGTMTLFLQLSSNLSSSFSALVALVPQAIGATTGAGRIMEVVNLPKEKRNNDEEAETIKKYGNENGVEISVENLEFTYKDGNQVLCDVSMKVSPGNIVALVGPSGEGKTTLVRILLGLINPIKGKVVLRTKGDIECEVSTDTRGAFAYVPQGNTIFAGTIEENMRMVKPDATDEEIKEALKVACALEFVEKMPHGIKSHVQERGKGISEGQAQRLSIARAVLRDVPIILFDEATSALDVNTERQVLSNILKNNSKKTCIVITHRPSVLEMCDKVYQINQTYLKELSEEEIQKLTENF